MLTSLLLVLTLLWGDSESFSVSHQSPTLCRADRNEDWTYRGDNGPSNWGDDYPLCREGTNQSPIELITADAKTDDSLGPLDFENYDLPISEAEIENNGHTIQVTPKDDVERGFVVNGAPYDLQHLHFHWGTVSNRGSEHVVDGVQYTMEMHLVHQNAQGDLAVVGVFFRERLMPNNGLKPIVDELYNMKFKGMESRLRSDLNLSDLLPANSASYFRYNGSLTTPECDEGVIWSVMQQPIPVGILQMLEFRKLLSAPANNPLFYCPLSDNYRPVQPLNDREVLLSQ